MFRLIPPVVVAALAALLVAATPPVEQVQGLYEGVAKTPAAEQKIEARLVAVGKGNYKLLIRQTGADGKLTKVELSGRTDKDTVIFAGRAGDVEWSGTCADGAVTGRCGQGTFEIKRVVRQSPTLGAPPPPGAVVLLDGKNFGEMVKKPLKDGKEQEWKIVEEGAIEVPKGGMNSRRTFEGSFKAHIEFKCPLMPEASGQGRGNSGCYMPNGEEIQVLDSFGMATYQGGGCGGLYRWKDPDAFDEFSLASAPPLQWQTYDIEYRVEKKDGKPVGKPRLTVFHNGIKIHDNVEMKNNARPGTFHFQDHGNPVHYRNIWVLPLD